MEDWRSPQGCLFAASAHSECWSAEQDEVHLGQRRLSFARRQQQGGLPRSATWCCLRGWGWQLLILLSRGSLREVKLKNGTGIRIQISVITITYITIEKWSEVCTHCRQSLVTHKSLIPTLTHLTSKLHLNTEVRHQPERRIKTHRQQLQSLLRIFGTSPDHSDRLVGFFSD